MKDFAVHRLRDDIAVVGWSCRLPGANSVDELWALLLEERCAISRVPADRFSLEKFGHPRKQEPGKSYSWAAGVLDDVWGFDPAVFGISPREAVQLDPQQRILLQLTWEALEDAGIRPSTIVNSDVGVFIGASQTDYGHAFFSDPAIADSHFAPGTAVAVLANRISYIYGLRGPSITIDTACSSSLVALHQAVEALRSGRIDTAIVGGSNLIASPASFIAFSQANMLSAAGLCQAFSAKADGFVRAEGAVVFVLRKAAHASAKCNPIHGLVLASDVNSDGRKNGISLPSVDAQEALIGRIYARNDIDTNRLAFVEAHGTGTPVGDPIEATAIGRSVGRDRTSPLPIGSIKTNIGHLEPASGLAGVLKALLALNHGVLPPSLHFNEPNPHINFDELNLSVCTQPLLLPNAASQYAGVNSFGFGGTNAHAVVAPGRKPIPEPPRHAKDDSPGVFAISANSNGALVALARDYVERVSQLSDSDTATLSSAIVHRRERHSNRIVVSSTRSEEVLRGLKSFISGTEDPALTIGNAIADEMPVAFVYSGNGSQWAGMGLSAYRHSAAFRTRFEEVDACFKQVGGWSLKDMLFSEELQERLPLTSVAQPLIFGIQSACTAALRASGLKPSAVLGHSVGEVAAAEAAGILDLRAAVKVIHFRSMHQERTHGAGRMAAVLGSADSVRDLAALVPGVEIAAINSPRAVTVAGSKEALAQFKGVAADRGVAVLDLELDYPFHTRLMAPIEHQLRADLRELSARDADVPFVSTVTGACLPGSRLDGTYWWRNVREPVQFIAAVRAAAQLGARYFVEIGPRPTLFKHITDSLQGEVNGFAALSVLDRNDEFEPFLRVRAKALVTGARVDTETIFGADPGPGIPLPRYPWQQSPFRFKSTVEATGGEVDRHPFAGVRSTADEQVWRAHIDTMLYPELADHKVGDQVMFPGTGFLEIALWVARQWLRTDNIVVSHFEIFNPLDLTGGETREVMTRVSPGSSTLEILSRPRLSQASWLTHCRCKIQTGNMSAAAPVLARSRSCRELTEADVYDIADASGLRYGPAFRLVRSAVVGDDGFISVDLAPSKSITSFTLDPMRLDAGAHGFFAVFPEVRAVERGVTYIPVRFDEVILYRPELTPERTLIEITSKNERSIVGDCYVFGADGAIIAVLRGVRTQAIVTRRTRAIESIAFVEHPCLIDGDILGETGVGVASKDVIASADALGMIDERALSGEADMLLEGWATAAAYEIASAFAEANIIDIDILAGCGRLPEKLRNWLVNLLAALEAADLAKREGSVWTLVADLVLPSSMSVVKVLAAEQQARAAETLLAAAISGFVKKIASEPGNEFGSVVPNAALDFYHDTNIELRETSDALHRLLQNNERLWPTNRSVRILQLGYGHLARSLLSAQRNILLTIFEPDKRRYESAELALANAGEVRLVDADHVHELGSYDLIVGVSALHRLQKNITLPNLRGLLAPGGLLIAVEPGASLFKDIVFGLDPGWFLAGAVGQPISPLRPIKQWVGKIGSAGFRNALATSFRCGSSLSYLVVAERAANVASASRPKKATALLIAPGHQTELVDRLQDALKDDGLVTSAVDDLADFPAPLPDHVLMVPDLSSNLGDSVAALTRRCLDLKTCAERIGNGPVKFWLLFSGALTSGPVCPVETGAWAFSRTLANEYPKLDVRRIDLAPNLPAERAVDLIQKVLFSDTDETELQVDEHGVRAVRVEALSRAVKARAPAGRMAARLERRSESGERLSWQPTDRRDPMADEVEIEVDATGLNFRDLMWSLSLLPEEMLEGGFSGAALGLECAGRIARVGAGVKNLKVGDRVMAFAASSFATHVCIKSGQAVKLPETISVDAAATIPVAFFTAYYSLVTQAKLSRREWVLIHGGAGAVGMAAIQVARSRGAKVIATAGSSAKRDLLRSLGVSHVLDSRSTSFVDEVRKITGIGVDVVLNSLAGETMERSIACLRPFGRFVELGKRDYVTNTHIGLRPFRKNLSYFGVDVDQVIGARRSESDKIFAKIVQLFGKGTFVPLPYSVFDADNVADAFHLMQQSGHVGKIVVRPPKTLAFPIKTPFHVSPEKTHIVTGAFGGFGMETAKWLVKKGARYLVMIGRRGAVAPEAQTLIKDFISRGVTVIADPCDVTDRVALAQLFEVIRTTMPPITGILHEAMVLDDAILANLDAERFNRVSAPKVAGVDNLEHLTDGMKLDYFVLFSSVTTLIGNPGQGNYVAANAYMEGVARRRRQQGLPALAIGWGPITDVGVVARSERLQSGLQKLVGVTGLRAYEALELMAQALEQSTENPDTAVMTVSPSEGSFGVDRLAVLRSPTYASYVRGGTRLGGSDATRIDLHELATHEGLEAARSKVGAVISLQLAHVLHLREEDINPTRPLGEVGLDSLMALELVMNLEKCFGINIPLSGSSGSMTISEIADEIIAHVGLDREEAVVEKLAGQHHGEFGPAQREALKGMLAEDVHLPKRLLS